MLYADETLEVFVLRASVLELISSMRLDDGKNIQSAKSDWSVLDTELNACFLPQPPPPNPTTFNACFPLMHKLEKF